MTDGVHVWAMMGNGAIGCYDFAGNEKWKFDLQQRYGKYKIAFGMSSTPILDGDKLYLQLFHTAYHLLIALDKATGAEVWKHDRTSDARAECEHSYASPTLYRDGKHEYLLAHGCDYVTAHNLKDGSELFRCGRLNAPGEKYNPTLRFVASPVAAEGLIVVPSAKNGPVLGLKVNAKGNITDTNDGHAWRMDDNTPDVPSPLVHDGLVYLCRENGVLRSRRDSVRLGSETRLAGGTIRSSLYAATDEARLPDAVVLQLTEIFSGDVDFHRELRKALDPHGILNPGKMFD